MTSDCGPPGQAYTGQEYQEIVLLTRPDGTRIRLGDVAEIRDQFAEVQSYSFFNGKRSFGINVMANEEENPIDVSAAVREFVDERNQTLPPEAQMTAWADNSFYLKGRIDMMLKNMALGAILVFIILGVFLHLKVAAWVIIGLPVAFLGAFMMMPSAIRGRDYQRHEPVPRSSWCSGSWWTMRSSSRRARTPRPKNTATRWATSSGVPSAWRYPRRSGVLTTIMAFTPMLLQAGATSSVAGAIALDRHSLPCVLVGRKQAHSARPTSPSCAPPTDPGAVSPTGWT